MLIIGVKYGQLANRLHLFGHFLANAVEYKYRLVNPAFDKYKSYFKATAANDFPSFDVSLKSSLLPANAVFLPLLRGVSRLCSNSRFHEVVRHKDNTVFFDLNAPGFVAKVRSTVVIVDGWYFRDYGHFRKHAQVLRRVFEPLDCHQEKIRALLEKCRGLGDVLVGVHVRRGDYRAWRGGQYCFSDHVYRDAMQQIASIFSARGRKTVFLLCSDERLNLAAFSPLVTISAAGHMVEDLYALAGCDYIVGPPSTYSMWGSFYGEVPLFHLTGGVERLAIEKFTVNYG